MGSPANTQMCAKATDNRCRGVQSPVPKSSAEVFFFLVSSFFSPKSGTVSREPQMPQLFFISTQLLYQDMQSGTFFTLEATHPNPPDSAF